MPQGDLHSFSCLSSVEFFSLFFSLSLSLSFSLSLSLSSPPLSFGIESCAFCQAQPQQVISSWPTGQATQPPLGRADRRTILHNTTAFTPALPTALAKKDSHKTPEVHPYAALVRGDPPFFLFSGLRLCGVYPSFRTCGVYPFPLFFQENGIHHSFLCSVTSGSGDRPRKEGSRGGGVYSWAGQWPFCKGPR